VAKFSRSGVWDKVPEGSTLIFGDVRISFQHNVGQVERKLPCQNQLDSFSRFDRTPTVNTQARRTVFVIGGGGGYKFVRTLYNLVVKVVRLKF